ncbi:hypothetical protein HZC33_00990 [Candidatus Wolfebacteria bacterium]|nr:hypothetical protein [Candidatus Wolfebacteria bacterium]
MLKITKYAPEIKKAKKEISDFFGFNLEIEIIIAKNRVEYEKLLGRKTADWEIGSYSPQEKNIKLLDPVRWKKDAPIHNPKKFSTTIKHELVHAYTNHLSKNKALPKWLNEGLAETISGSGQNKKNQYFETDFCSKLDTPFNWSQRVNSGSGAYATSYLFTRYLLNKYGFKTIKKLIQAAPIYYSYNRFDKIAINIFGKNLAKLEEEFLDNIQ